MKKLLCFLVLAVSATLVTAQLVTKTKCPDLVVDVLDGKVTGIKSNAQDYEIRKALPCFTGSEPDNSSAKCGGGVFYKDKDVYFFTDRDYIQIGPKFKGKMTLPLIGSKRNSFFTKLGNPKMSDDSWDAWVMSYGTLVLHYDKAGKVNRIEMSTKGMDAIQLCE